MNTQMNPLVKYIQGFSRKCRSYEITEAARVREDTLITTKKRISKTPRDFMGMICRLSVSTPKMQSDLFGTRVISFNSMVTEMLLNDYMRAY